MADLVECGFCKRRSAAELDPCPFCGTGRSQPRPAGDGRVAAEPVRPRPARPTMLHREPGAAGPQPVAEPAGGPVQTGAGVLRIGAAGPPITIPPGGRVVLGRMSADDAVGRALHDDDFVGKHHAAVVMRGRQVEVRDLDSVNGTSVDGHRLPKGGGGVFDLPVVIRLRPHCNVRVDPAG
ncbi:FHA domain-containing protein [Micromonospora sp. BL1]|nr:FHA domain-containing protein [Micromonospora sp. BL1]